MAQGVSQGWTAHSTGKMKHILSLVSRRFASLLGRTFLILSSLRIAPESLDPALKRASREGFLDGS